MAPPKGDKPIKNQRKPNETKEANKESNALIN